MTVPRLRTSALPIGQVVRSASSFAPGPVPRG